MKKIDIDKALVNAGLDSKKSNKQTLIVMALLLVIKTSYTYAAQTNSDFTLNDGVADSPTVIMVDADSKQLILQKLDAGAATLFNDEGSICLLPSNDTDDHVCFVTTADQPALMWSGINAIEPGIQVSVNGKLQYRNAAGSWSDFDSLNGGAASISDGGLTPAKTALADGSIIVGNGSVGAAVAMSGDIAISNTGVTSIAGEVVVDADISSTANIAGSKINPDFGSQAVATTGDISGGAISGAAVTATGDVTVANAKSVKLSELSLSGTNTVSLKAPDAVTADVTLTLPDGAGTNGQILQTDGSGVLSWTAPGVVFATGVLASFGYHTSGGCESTEKFIQYATVDSTAYGLCVEKSERSAQAWGDANAICLGLGKRLPDYSEWRKACDGKTSGVAGTTDSDFLQMTGNWEWASSRPSVGANGSNDGAGSVVAGESSCASVYWNWVRNDDGVERSNVFRCVR